MHQFVTLATEQLNETQDAVDLKATAINIAKNTRNRACVRIIFTTSIEHSHEALTDIHIPVSALNRILDVQLTSFMKEDGTFLDRALLKKEAKIEGTTLVYTAAGKIPPKSIFKIEVVGTN
jgi:hypothetical protein